MKRTAIDEVRQYVNTTIISTDHFPALRTLRQIFYELGLHDELHHSNPNYICSDDKYRLVINENTYLADKINKID